MLYDFTPDDEKRIEDEGLTVDKVLVQLDCFRKGAAGKRLARPCSLGDGVMAIKENEESGLIKRFEEAAHQGRVTKFVPASGAATRMFRDWYAFFQGACPEKAVEDFFSSLARYPFYEELKKVVAAAGMSFDALAAGRDIKKILKYILTPAGLNYGSLPKALVSFHGYPGRSRKSLEEHLVEAALYACDGRKTSRLHFTVSPEHESAVREFLHAQAPFYEDLCGISYDLSLSTQGRATNTIMVDLQNTPVRDSKGNLVFRPGGHGALLANLNSLDGDIIFIKNIDNVVKDALKPITVRYKKLLGGYLVELQDQIFDYLRRLSSHPDVDAGLLADCEAFCRDKLNFAPPRRRDAHGSGEKREFLFKMMNRPLRVCGVVRNEGEPGGGPFWVRGHDTGESLQIVEEAQVDASSEEQRRIWREASYFNPVDLVCGVRDFRGRKFDLNRFSDPDDFLVTRKTQDNREVKALELPGLWNGAMAFWNTIFIEVPIETFNPVKEVRDLLRPQHLA